MKFKGIALLLSSMLAVTLLTMAPSTAQSGSVSGARSVSSADPATGQVALTKGDKKKKKKKGPKIDKKYRPRNGALFNNPMHPQDRYKIERHVLRAIRNAWPKSYIRLSLYSLDRPPVAKALIAAKRRGVRIQILVNDHTLPYAQRLLRGPLGTNRKKRSFIYQCKAGCRTDANDVNNLHSKFYLFSHTGKARKVLMVGSANMTLNAERWQWNDLWTHRNMGATYDQFVKLFNDMRVDYSKRRPTYLFCSDDRTPCDANINKHVNWVFPRYTTPRNDLVLDILNGVTCIYPGPKGKPTRTVLRLNMHSMRGKRGDYLARRIRELWAAGCDFRVSYGMIGYYTKQIIGAPTRRGRIPLRSSGFDLVDREPLPGFSELERYSHQKYFIIKGSWMGNNNTNLVFTGSSNWASLGTPQDEIVFTVNSAKAVRQYLANFNFMWRPPYSRNAYTTTPKEYTVRTKVNGEWQTVTRTKMVQTVEPDRMVPGKTWEND